MKLVYKIFEILRASETRSRGKISAALIAPGAVKGMLGDRHELDMGISQPLYIGDELVCYFSVVEIRVAVDVCLSVSGPP